MTRPEPKRNPPAAPNLLYLPQDPVSYRPAIGLVGCGGISHWHLTAYRKAGYRVAVLCDLAQKLADKRKAEFYPQAVVTTDFRQVLARDDVEVVDITAHPAQRLPLIEAALAAGKHVLSQKPFVLDLDAGEALVRLAERQGLCLAVNQNARWAPHFSYLRQAVALGLLGELSAVHFAVHWDHGWVAGTPFENMRHLVLYDFAIHWFDMLACLMGDRPCRRVTASFAPAPQQTVRPPLLAQAMVEYEHAQATLVFDADTGYGAWETAFVAGTQGSIRCEGPDSKHQELTIATAEGTFRPELTGSWFPDGFHGAMGELLLAIEEKREPSHSAGNNLKSLALCFAAVESAERGVPVVPGTSRRLWAAAV